MRVSHVSALLKETGSSPEQLAKRVGVSHMTVRRWLKRPACTEIQRIYSRALEDAVCEFVGEGTLTAESAIVQEIIVKNELGPFQAILRNLGLSKDFLSHTEGGDKERLIMGLSQIGASHVRKTQVEGNLKKISRLRRLGKEWSLRIAVLLRVVRSKRIASVEKLVAYGALFYLICPFDFIPDYLSVVGYLDDFVMLGLAADFFLEKN